MYKSSYNDRRCSESAYIPVNGIVINVFKRGILTDTDGTMIIIIPGNPGVMEFYDDFMDTLYTASNKTIPVWGLSHSGHVSLPAECKDEKNYGPFTLQEQIKHKVHFIQEHIPRTTNLILIGHSIGCHMILEMSKQLPDKQITKCILLFPTIERMAVSPKGKVVTPLLNNNIYMKVTLWCVHLLSWLPRWLQYQIATLFFRRLPAVSQCAIHASLSLVDHNSVHAALYMARDEMNQVVHLDNNYIKECQPKLIFYYGAKDPWCPVSYYNDMKEKHPEVEIYLCEKGMEHAYVLESSTDMAHIVWHWIKDM